MTLASWQIFAPILKRLIDETVNVPTSVRSSAYRLMNGQPSFHTGLEVHELPLSDVRRFLVCSDRFLPFGMISNTELPRTAETLFAGLSHVVKTGGISLDWVAQQIRDTRRDERGESAKSHTPEAELSLVLFTF